MLKVLMAILCSVNFITGPFTKLKTDTSKLGGEVVSVYKDVSKQIIRKKDELKLTEKEVKEIEELNKKLDDNKISEKDKQSAMKELCQKIKTIASKSWSIFTKAVSVIFGAAVTFKMLSGIVLNLFGIEIKKDKGGKYYINNNEDPVENPLLPFLKAFYTVEDVFSNLLDFSRFKIGVKEVKEEG